MSEIVTENAIMQCTLGAAPAPLVVTSQTLAKILKKSIATEADKAPIVNIPSFGACNSCSPSKPCVPAPIQWSKTSVNKVSSLKILTKESFCMCSLGGKISFTNSGSNTFVDTE